MFNFGWLLSLATQNNTITYQNNRAWAKQLLERGKITKSQYIRYYYKKPSYDPYRIIRTYKPKKLSRKWRK